MSSFETAIMEDGSSISSSSSRGNSRLDVEDDDCLNTPTLQERHLLGHLTQSAHHDLVKHDASFEQTEFLKKKKNSALKPVTTYGTMIPSMKESPDLAVLAAASPEDMNDVEITDTEKGGISSNEALYHIICVMAGSGLLQIPFALRLSGWVGIPLILFSTFVTEYTGRLLVQCLYSNGVRINGGFPEIGLNAYGEKGRWFVMFFYNVVLLGVACLYIILSSLNLTLLIGIFSQSQWIIISTIVSVIPFIVFPSLKEVAVVSLFGSLASILVVFAVFIVGLYDMQKPDWSPQYDFMVPSSLASAMATFTFSFGGNFVYPEVEHSMAKPEEFPKVLNQAMWIIMGLYLLIGGIGYGCYGRDVLSPILLNMSPGFITTTSILLVTLHVLLACPILLTTFSLGIERKWKGTHVEEGTSAMTPLLGERPFESEESLIDETYPAIDSPHGLSNHGQASRGNESTTIPIASDESHVEKMNRRQRALTTQSAQTLPVSQSWQDFIRVKAFRMVISVIICLVALSVPYFSDLMGLLGAVANTMLIFIFPVVFYIKLYPEKCESLWDQCILYGILAIGVLAGSVGGYEALMSLISHYIQPPESR